MVRLFVWNILHGGGSRRIPHIALAILDARPDVVALSEYRRSMGGQLAGVLADHGLKHQLCTDPPGRKNGVLLASRVMVAREAATCDAAKQLIVDAPGVEREADWERTYDGAAGGVNVLDGANLPVGIDGFCCGENGTTAPVSGALQRMTGLTFDAGIFADTYLTFSLGQETVNPGGPGLLPGDTVRYFARAIDNSPGAQVSVTPEYVLRMPEAAELRREAEEAFETVAERLEELAVGLELLALGLLDAGHGEDVQLERVALDLARIVAPHGSRGRVARVGQHRLAVLGAQ